MVVRRWVWRAAWGYLALVLLLAPLLGLMHGVVHGAGKLPQVAQAQGAEAPGLAHGHGWVDDLFAAHAHASDCRVFDQLCHSGAPPATPVLVLPMALSPFVFHFLRGEVLARRAALFEARGPPPAR
jgi:hypothetical protein